MIPMKNIHNTLIPNEQQTEDVKVNDLKSKYLFCTYATTQQVLLRASSEKKILFLCELFNDIKHHKFMVVIHRLFMKYFTGKLSKYLYTLDQSDYIFDMQLKDNNRAMEDEEVTESFQATLFWFKFIDSMDLKLSVFLSFLSMCGNIVIRKTLLYMKEAYKTEALQEAGSSHFASLAFPNSVLFAYREENDSSDPDVQLINRRRKEWDDMITKYRTRVENSIQPTALKKALDRKAKEASASKTGKKGKSGKGGKSTKAEKSKSKSKDKKTKKSKSNKSAKAGKPEIDYIQLLPIWITMKIFKYLDEKTLKTIKSVNKYWEFVVTALNQEEKGRKKLDEWITSLEEELGLTDMVPIYPLSVKPQYRFQRHKQNLVACDPRVREALLQLNQPKTVPNTSILSNIANHQEIEFNMPANSLQPFQRMIEIDDEDTDDSTKFIHQRPSCVQYDYNTIARIPIKDIKLTSNYIDEYVTDDAVDFEYRPSASVYASMIANKYTESVLNTMIEQSISRLGQTSVLGERASSTTIINTMLTQTDFKRLITASWVNLPSTSRIFTSAMRVAKRKVEKNEKVSFMVDEDHDQDKTEEPDNV